jgi:protoporphyrinogen oxidase
MTATPTIDVAIVGGGFTGLAAAYEFAERGVSVTVFEAESDIGGLAAAFEVGGERLDRFYHHWFTSDRDAMQLIAELGLDRRLDVRPTRTGVYYANRFFRLSTPWDLLNFTPLGFLDRIRLGLLALRARSVRDWRTLERKSAREWLQELGGENVYRVIWEPLLKGKFGPYADDISAVWFWNKLKLRGGSRGKGGEERLAYFQGGFIGLAEALAERVRTKGGAIRCADAVRSITPEGDLWRIASASGDVLAKRVVATTSLPLIADMIAHWAPTAYLDRLNRIRYIGNVCMVLELDRPLSDTYWLNVNDPSFPFVGVIEHTNFERPETYGGRHIAYLSKYLPHTDPLFALDADEFLAYALPYLKNMFPALERAWIREHHLWRARWSQPVIEKRYGALIPEEDTPFPGLHLCTMAQIYPEDRGTNYAIRAGRTLARRLLETR